MTPVISQFDNFIHKVSKTNNMIEIVWFNVVKKNIFYITIRIWFGYRALFLEIFVVLLFIFSFVFLHDLCSTP